MRSFGDEFTSIYSLSKTLKFELRPVPETKEALDKEDSIIKNDLIRKEAYPVLKELLDSYYRYYIENALTEFSLSESLLKNAYSAYETQNDSEMEKTYAALRKCFANAFKNKSDYLLDKYDKLITLTEKAKEEYVENGKKKSRAIECDSKLVAWIKQNNNEKKTEQYMNAIKAFNKFTTYLTGYKETRENMFSTEAKASAISYRSINQNMSFFFANIRIFKLIESKYPELFGALKEFSSYFEPERYGSYITQSKIDQYNYQCIGRPADDTDFKGVNSIINEYRQKNSLKNRDLPTMKMLYKQILSDRENSYMVESLDNEADAIALAKDSYNKAYRAIEDIHEFIEVNLTKENYSNIYVKTQSLTEISHELFGDWSVLRNILSEKNYSQDLISLAEVDKFFYDYCNSLDEDDKTKYIDAYELLAYYNKIDDDLEELPAELTKLTQYKPYLDRIIHTIKRYKGLYLYNGSKVMAIPEGGQNFSTEFNVIFEVLQRFTKDYDKIRNFATKKPYSEEKIKLNFNIPTLLAGWDINKEIANVSFLFVKNNKYYLGIADVAHRKIFDISTNEMKAAMDQDDDCYSKIQYKQISGAAKMLPKVVFSGANKDIFKDIITDRILEIREKKLYTTAAKDKKAMIEWIDFMKKAVHLHPEWNEYFTYSFKPSADYENANEFYEEMDKQSYALSKIPVRSKYIESLVRSHKLYLFQIYSKDFSDNKKKIGTDNLHTMYWKALFSDENLQAIKGEKQAIFKLNGEAELFMRNPSLERKITHPKNESLKNKNPLNPKKESVFTYDLIKNKRYTERKYFFHCPITLNFRAGTVTPKEFNTKVNRFIEDNKDVCLIGIDRGERHLLYYTVINQDGDILEQGSLNRIQNSYTADNGVSVSKVTDYHKLLDIKEKGKHAAQQAWDTIENIKELKAGYLSQVVYQLTQLMVKYNAIVVLENLNLNFKRGRIKVEKQVYQKFEKALINKLNYIVFKDRGYDMIGSYAKGLQLAAPFESFERLGNQTGCVYYVVPSYTSHIDPKTGFVNLLGSKLRYENIKKSIDVLKRFDSICYNRERNYFEFSFDYHNFGKDVKMERYKWTICTHGDLRWGYSLKDSQPVAYCVTDRLKELFMSYSIDFSDGKELVDKITSIEEKRFLSSVLFYLRLVLQMRYTIHGSEDENDFILSPVEYAPGKFFDSRQALDNEPQNADSNGAYHIALKGLMTIRRINNGDITRFKSGEERYEWLKFMQLRSFKE